MVWHLWLPWYTTLFLGNDGIIVPWLLHGVHVASHVVSVVALLFPGKNGVVAPWLLHVVSHVVSVVAPLFPGNDSIIAPWLFCGCSIVLRGTMALFPFPNYQSLKAHNFLNNGLIFNLWKVLESAWSPLPDGCLHVVPCCSPLFPWVGTMVSFPFQSNLTPKSCDHPKPTNQEPWFIEISQ